MTARNNKGGVTIRDVTRTAVAMKQMSKLVSAEMNTCNDKGAVISMLSMPRSYKKDKRDRLSQLNFETPVCQDMSFGAEELN
jgi:hypothetical protein